jgi:hypothetical protein
MKLIQRAPAANRDVAMPKPVLVIPNFVQIGVIAKEITERSK